MADAQTVAELEAELEFKKLFRRYTPEWYGEDVHLEPDERQCSRCGIIHKDRRRKNCEFCRAEIKGVSLMPNQQRSQESACGFSMVESLMLRRTLANINGRSTVEILHHWFKDNPLRGNGLRSHGRFK